MAQKARPLKPILAYPNKAISQLCLQINQQLALLDQVKAVLPKELVDHALHCLLNNKRLLVYTDSAIWASQLRFHGKTMLAAIKSAHPGSVYVLLVKITNDPTIAKVIPKRKPTIPSQSVAYEIRNQSLIATDPQLKQALAKLSATLIRLQAKN